MTGTRRQRLAPQPIGGAGFQPDLRADPVARQINRPCKRHLAPGDDRHFVAQSLSMRDHVGRENHRGARRRKVADRLFKLALVDRIEPRKRLVKHHQPRLMHQGSEQLDLLRHALGQLPDLAVDGIAKPVFFQQRLAANPAFLQRQSAQCAQKGNRLIGLHRGVKPALFGQVADGVRHFVRAVMPQHPAQPGIRIDDPQQHPQGGGLARTVRAQNAVNCAFGNGQIDAIDRRETIEPLNQASCFNREGRLNCQRPASYLACRRWRVAPHLPFP